MNLSSYSGKKVRVTSVDGQVLLGIVDLYTQALDNVPEEESISLDNGDEETLTEIFKSEIRSIEVIEE